MSASKRTSGAAGNAPSPSPAKIARKAKAEMEANISTVVEALKTQTLMPSGVPMKVLEMLAAGAPHALAAAVEERHTLQATVIGHIQEVLEQAAGGLATRLSEAQAAADAKNGELQAMSSKVEDATKDIEAAEAATEEQRKKLSEREQALQEAQREEKAAEANVSAAGREHLSIQKRVDALKAIEETGLVPLVEGAQTNEKEAKKISVKFIKDMQKLGAEQSLLDSAPAVLGKPADQRQGFDQMVIESLTNHLKEKISAAEAALAESGAKSAELQTTATAKAAAVEGARQAQSAEGDTLKDMEADVASKRSHKRELEGEVETLSSAHAEKVGAVADVQEEVQCLQEAKDAFDSLVSRSSMPAPEE